MISTGITQQDIEALVRHDGWPAISITLSTPRSGPGVQQGPIRLKKLLVAAEEKLVEGQMRRTVARDVLAEAANLVTNVEFWNQRFDGVAIFIAAGRMHVFHLPFSTDDSLEIAARFNVLPLLPAFSSCPPYSVLVLDKQHTRLIRCTDSASVVTKVEGMPTDIAAFAHAEHAPDTHQQHFAAPGRTVIGPGGGDPGAIESARLRRFFTAVDHAVCQHLKGAHEALVLAGTRDAQAVYRHGAKYPYMLPQGLVATSKNESNEDLRLAARPLVTALADKPRHAEVERYRSQAGTGLTSQQIGEILVAADAGKVEALLIGSGEPIWGTFNNETGAVAVSQTAMPTDENLVNRAALDTLRHKGSVFPVKPEELVLTGATAAVFRF